jgi:hypothetical protein
MLRKFKGKENIVKTGELNLRERVIIKVGTIIKLPMDHRDKISCSILVGCGSVGEVLGINSYAGEITEVEVAFTIHENITLRIELKPEEIEIINKRK